VKNKLKQNNITHINGEQYHQELWWNKTHPKKKKLGTTNLKSLNMMYKKFEVCVGHNKEKHM